MEVWRKDALLRGYNSSLALPIIIKGKAIGAFMLYSTEAFFFNEAEINLMVSITEDIAYAMEMLDAEKKRKQNEQALQESENRYRNLIMQSPDAIFVNMNNKVSLVNQACLKLFGAKEENELLGKSIFSLFHPDFHEKISERISILSEKDQSVPLIEERIIRMDGSYLDVDVLAAPFHYMGENGIHVVLRDISIRKQAALKAINDTLEQKVKERTAQLSEAVKELEAFSYSVSHDLRTPLRGIDGWSWVLLEDYDDILDGQSKEYLGFIRSEAQRMGQTIDSLLKLAKMNITEMQEQEVDVSVLARNSILHLKSMKPERQVEMAIEPNLYVKGDQSQLDLVISNLVGNAWKFTAVKEIARLEFGTIRQNDEQVFYLKDNGIGFDMTYYNKLFQPFQRLHNDIEYPGTGIGLAIIKRIIKRHGGRVWAEGCVGGGATFFFTLWGKDSKTQELENPS
jgi:PAS domain S-box-containing protein